MYIKLTAEYVAAHSSAENTESKKYTHHSSVAIRNSEPRRELGTKTTTTSTILVQYLLGWHDFVSQFSRIRAQLIDGCFFPPVIIAYGQGGSSNRDEKMISYSAQAAIIEALES
jgi:hypothetical protein